MHKKHLKMFVLIFFLKEAPLWEFFVLGEQSYVMQRVLSPLVPSALEVEKPTWAHSLLIVAHFQMSLDWKTRFSDLRGSRQWPCGLSWQFLRVVIVVWTIGAIAEDCCFCLLKISLNFLLPHRVVVKRSDCWCVDGVWKGDQMTHKLQHEERH